MAVNVVGTFFFLSFNTVDLIETFTAFFTVSEAGY